jgi:hypothetical protein
MISALAMSLPLRALLTVAFLSPLAFADGPNISGKYQEVSGTAVDIKHEGVSVSIQPESLGKGMPKEVQSSLGALILRGAIAQKDGGFQIDAKYQGDVSPNPHVKIKVNVELLAQGAASDHGLLMKACDYKLNVVIFSGGEIAGSESRTEKCVGLWKRQP